MKVDKQIRNRWKLNSPVAQFQRADSMPIRTHSTPKTIQAQNFCWANKASKEA